MDPKSSQLSSFVIKYPNGHGQTPLKQRCIDVTDVDTTLFRRRLAMTWSSYRE